MRGRRCARVTSVVRQPSIVYGVDRDGRVRTPTFSAVLPVYGLRDSSLCGCRVIVPALRAPRMRDPRSRRRHNFHF